MPIKKMTKPRSDRLSWDEYFMAVATIVALRSEDPSTQVGSVVVNRKNRIVGTGYNGMPPGCPSDAFPWDKEGEYGDTKYPYLSHSECNCLDSSIAQDLEGCTIYVTLHPCPDCAKAIIRRGLKRVVYRKLWDDPNVEISRRLFEATGISCEKYVPSGKRLEIEI